jgi:hypothetical protein
VIAYFDTSALVKMFLPREEGFPAAVDLWNAADLATSSRITYPEARAAIAGARRADRLTSRATDRARRSLDAVFPRLVVIELDRGVADSAGNAADRFGLRANDAIHLASALALDDPNVVLVTWDRELAGAARHAGLGVAP